MKLSLELGRGLWSEPALEHGALTTRSPAMDGSRGQNPGLERVFSVKRGPRLTCGWNHES